MVHNVNDNLTSVRPNFGLVVQELDEEAQDFILAYLLVGGNLSELERLSEGKIKRIAWKEILLKIITSEKLRDLACKRAAVTDKNLKDVYRNLILQIDPDTQKESTEGYGEILVADLTQMPQKSFGNLAVEAGCRFKPGEGNIYEIYDPNEGVRVNVKRNPAEFWIKLDPLKMVDVDGEKYELVFNYRSDNISEFTIKFERPSEGPIEKAEVIQRYKHKMRRTGDWEKVMTPIPKEIFRQIVIAPETEGIFYLSKVKLKIV